MYLPYKIPGSCGDGYFFESKSQGRLTPVTPLLAVDLRGRQTPPPLPVSGPRYDSTTIRFSCCCCCCCSASSIVQLPAPWLEWHTENQKGRGRVPQQRGRTPQLVSKQRVPRPYDTTGRCSFNGNPTRRVSIPYHLYVAPIYPLLPIQEVFVGVASASPVYPIITRCCRRVEATAYLSKPEAFFLVTSVASRRRQWHDDGRRRRAAAEKVGCTRARGGRVLSVLHASKHRWYID